MCPLLEKYGTFIARCNALIEKVSPCVDCAVFGIDTLSPAVVPSATCKPTSSPATPSPASTVSVPLLYELNASVTTGGVRVFVASTKISDLIAHRYAPRDHWRSVLTYILDEFFQVEGDTPLPLWTPAVGPAYSADATLPPTHRVDAVVASTNWFFEERGPPPGELMCNHWCGSGCNRCQAPSGVNWPGSFGMQTSANASIFYRGALNCGVKEDLPQSVKDAAICGVEGTNGVIFRKYLLSLSCSRLCPSMLAAPSALSPLRCLSLTLQWISQR
eukprot:SAG31_NODE_4922_length_2863_cov_1.316570_2_plen_274_part_00